MKASLSPRTSEHVSYGSLDTAGDPWSNKSTPPPAASGSGGLSGRGTAAVMQVHEKQVVVSVVDDMPQKSFQAVSFHDVSYAVRPFICSSQRKEILHAVRYVDN